MTESAENTGAAAVESASPHIADKPKSAKPSKAKPKVASSKKKAVPSKDAAVPATGAAAAKLTTVRFERYIPAPTELPRASLDKSAPWRAESVAKTREIADNLGVTAQIEKLTFQGASVARTAALLAAVLEPAVSAAASQNDAVPRSTRDFVSEVRLSLGAPEHDDPAKIAEWKAASATRLEAGEPTYNLRYFDNRTVIGRDSNIRESALSALIGPDAAAALSALPGERGEDLADGVRREFGALSGKKARELVDQAARYKAGLVDPELNTIEPGFEKERTAPTNDRQQTSDRAAATREDTTPDNARDSIGDSTSAEQPRRAQDPKFIPPVPGHVASRYSAGEKGQYFFDRERRKLAFEDKGTRLQTMDASPVVAESLVEIAMSRGWETLAVRGSTEFRREVWLAAELAGAKVIGYDPTPADKLTLEHKLEERGVSHRDAAQRAHTGENTVEPAKEKDLDQTAPDGRKRASTARTAEAEEEADAAFPGAREGMFAGKVLEHGEAPYKHQKDNSNSYFVRLEDEKGRTTEVWGKDLARGMQDADAKIGDTVTLTRVEQKPVVVKETVRDNAGKAIGVREKDALLNGWDVEKAQTFRTADRTESLKQHPDLIGAHATMATTVEALANKFPKMATPIREAFREGIAQKIERGEKVNPPKVRVQSKETTRRHPPERTQRARSADVER